MSDKARRKQWIRYWVFDPLFGMSGFFIHIVNFVLYILIAMLLFFIIKKVGSRFKH